MTYQNETKVKFTTLVFLVLMLVVAMGVFIGSLVYGFTDLGNSRDGGQTFGFSEVRPVTLIGGSAASSTMTQFDSTGTTTAAYHLFGTVDLIDINVNFYATTSVSELFTTVYFSNDSGCSSSTDPDINWYVETTKTVSEGKVVHVPMYHQAEAADLSMGDNLWNIQLTNISTECFKTVFYTNSTTDNSLISVELSLKEYN